MAATKELTRAQHEALDNIVALQSPAEVEKMGYQEKLNYRELLAVRDAQEAEFMAEGNQQQGVVLEPVVEPPAPPVPTPEPTKADEPTPEPEPEPETQPVVAADPAELAAWREKAETYQKRYRDAQSALSPAQQNAASMRKKLDEKDSAVSELAQEMAEIKKLLAQRAQPVVAQPAFDPSDEFAQTYPEVAARLAAVNAQIQEQVEARLRKIEADREAERQAAHERELASYQSQHFAFVKQRHPDIEDLIAPDKRGPEVAQWLTTQPPLFQQVMSNPYAHTPQDVAFVLDAFKGVKRATNGVTAKKPTLGDLATKAKGASVIPTGQSEVSYLSEEEMSPKNFDKLLQNAAGKSDEAINDLLARYEATLARNAK